MRRLILLSLLILIISCTGVEPQSETRFLMGTEVQITVYSEMNASSAISAAFDEIARLEALMSNYRNDSEVSQLNRYRWLNASPETLYVVNRSLYYSQLSNGAFDITVQPLLDRWSRAKEGDIPTRNEISEILQERIGYEHIKINGSMIQLKRRGMKITLGGIAKGYAVDKAVEVLQQHGIESGLVNAGGDLYVLGKKPRNKPWQIALRNPRDQKDYITIIKAINKSITTSGDYERYFIEKKAHHIVDPKTGYSADQLISVTIIDDKAIDADALATAVFVLGVKGMNLIESIEGVEGLLITKEKIILKSSGWE